MRIGQFLHHYPGPGGTTEAVRGLSRALARLGHEVTIYSCAGGDSDLLPEVAHALVRAASRLVSMPRVQTSLDAADTSVRATEISGGGAGEPRVLGFPRPGALPFGVSEALLARLWRNEERLEVLVIHGLLNPANVIVSRAAKAAGIPYIASPHGMYHPALLRKHPLKKQVYGSLVERPYLNRAAAVQVLDELHLPYLASFGVTAPAFVVPNGFEPDEIPDTAGTAQPAGENIEFLFLGRLDAYTKGLDLLLEAFARARNQRKLPEAVRLNFVGPDTGDGEALRRQSQRLGVEDQVRFAGPVTPGERWRVIGRCHLLVHPSRHDAFPLSVLEAMVAGKPVLISSQTGTASWIRRAGSGFLVEPAVESIEEGLARAVERRDDWPAMGERGRSVAYAQLTWDCVARRAADAYAALLSRPAMRESASFTRQAVSG